MQTRISKQFNDTTAGQTANQILRSCVHCGFCTATCPTYQILGDELDSPRGRIYLIKQLLEGTSATSKTRLHLDRCLTCRSCETTCPSGVEYAHLLDIGREIVARQTIRPLHQILLRKLLLWALPSPARFRKIIKLANLFRFLLPGSIKESIPLQHAQPSWPQAQHRRKILLLEGCVQSTLAPEINTATARLLNRVEIETVRVEQSCCGALAHHLSATTQSLATIKTNIDIWWPFIEQGIEAIVSNASGCGVMVKDYAHLLQHDQDYADKARTVSGLCRDISEILANENLSKITRKPKIAFQSPCTLQHGQQLNGVVEQILEKVGFELVPYNDKHLCCGSAGTYSITQKKLSQKLLANKLSNLLQNKPELMATANIGCLLHLRSQSPVPVMHWVELLDSQLSDSHQ